MAPPGSTPTTASSLAEAWDSGAEDWTAAERQAYANDLRDERALIAVTAKFQPQRVRPGPSIWMPPADGNRCDYVSQWVAIKTGQPYEGLP
ncbi:hypothetical protein ACFVXC_18235 [Streptomyces sp. NPDC058257]|uniref:hypothetical protein n=1 Tax=Streptomyces sp. NPDC058257 TaxID=3346409 RepID=UPI0036E44832